MSRKDEFQKRLDQYAEDVSKLQKQYNILANIRLLVILAAIALSIAVYRRDAISKALLIGGISLILVIFVVVKHYKLKQKLNRAKGMVEINKSYIDRFGGDWVRFQDCGKDFVDQTHPFTSDLDIFGEKSLFQWINVAKTFYGRQNLKDLLTGANKDKGSIEKRQEAVAELAEKLEFCQELQWEGMKSKEIGKNPERLLMYAEDLSKLVNHVVVRSIFYILPFSLLLSIVLKITGSPIPSYIPIGILVIQLMIYLEGIRKNTKILNTVYEFKRDLNVFSSLLLLIEKEEMQSQYLKELKEGLLFNNQPASKSIGSLEKISNYIDVRYNGILYLILNITLLWDYHCVFELERWKEKNGGVIRRTFDTIGKFEAISSLAVVEQLYPQWIYPTISEKEMSFSAVEMGHPLINKEACVRNSINIEKSSCIITGSNMSGKTTFLRTIGINLVLAYAGGAVYANKLETSIMDIFTSMRISDDLNSGISTFYAELLRIKEIIEYSRQKKPMIYLIDEMFRGTNSKDRIIGAQSVLKNLSKDWVIGLISTHDFELCDLELDKNLKNKNYHFTEYYENNEIKFDYSLRSGRCKTTNAKYLMKLVGINID